MLPTRYYFPKQKQLIQLNIKKKSIQKMDRRSKQMFLQRRHTDDQQAHEKMLNITNHEGNANQNHLKCNETAPVRMPHFFSEYCLLFWNSPVFSSFRWSNSFCLHRCPLLVDLVVMMIFPYLFLNFMGIHCHLVLLQILSMNFFFCVFIEV